MRSLVLHRYTGTKLVRLSVASLTVNPSEVVAGVTFRDGPKLDAANSFERKTVDGTILFLTGCTD